MKTHTKESAVEQFLNKYQDQITGCMSVFDRIIFKGNLPISYPKAAEGFLFNQGVLIKDFRHFTGEHTDILKQHAQKMAADAGRPYEYHRFKTRKDDYALKMAQRDGITDGLICVIARNEENHSFGLRYGKGRPELVRNSPKSLTLYYYYMDRHFGLMHIRLSTWMPFSIQVYINGHEWLARQMSAKGIEFEQYENAFTYIADVPRAQRLADKMGSLKWEKILHVFARRVNPLLKTILKGMEYYWVTDQAEYATDVMIGNSTWLDELYIKWQKHAAVCFQAEDIMTFMGRKLHSSFNSTIVTNVKKRPSVTRIKHSVGGNWIKMYNKNGIVLRVETVINRPSEFRVFRIGKGTKAGYHAPMRKKVTNMKRYADIALRANRAYLNALADVDDPTGAYQDIKQLCEPARKGPCRVRGINPLREDDRILLEAIMKGQHHLHGFKANQIAHQIGLTYSDDPATRRKQSAWIYRKLKMLRAHGLIRRMPRSKRYRITQQGAKLINAVIDLYHVSIPDKVAKAA